MKRTPTTFLQPQQVMIFQSPPISSAQRGVLRSVKSVVEVYKTLVVTSKKYMAYQKCGASSMLI